MTCIVALTDGKSVLMGGDSAGSEDSGVLHIRNDGKVWRTTTQGDHVPVVMGCSGVSAIQQAIRWGWQPPALTDSPSITEYIVLSFVPALRNRLREEGQLVGGRIEGHVMVGISGRIFALDTALAAIEEPEPFNAVGSAANEAKCVLWGLKEASGVLDHSLNNLKLALRCAERYDNGVRGPFHFVSTDEDL